jgi:transcriptional regulator with XRE-family HTH domain
MRIRILRKRCGLSVRELALRSELSPAMISYAERGVNSMSLVTLEKILSALGCSVADFFAEGDSAGRGPVFPRERMRVVSDHDRTYTILFGRLPGVPIEMCDEHIMQSMGKPSFSTLKHDIAGYLLAGSLVLEFRGAQRKLLRAGDAFHIPKNTAHRGYASDDEGARLITIACLPSE